jgi:hypothetical protein
MNFIKTNLVSVIYLFLFTTLFMPWILVPDPATLTVQPVTGLSFLSDNVLMLIFLSLIIFTYAFSLKVKSIRILILLELELIFLIALFLSPIVSQGLVFFSGVKYGYFLILILLIGLAFYYYLLITKYIQNKENS